MTIQKFRKFNQLKNVYRATSVVDRKESSAEHTWSSLMLADYFLEQDDMGLDRLKVFEILMYHDVVEIEAGDTPIHLNADPKKKQEKEMFAAKKLVKELPEKQANKFLKLFNEFENKSSKEARFAKAIDQLDAVINQLEYKEKWSTWSKEYIIEKKEKYFEEFPNILKEFRELLVYLEEENYFGE